MNMATQGVLPSMGRIMRSYSCIGQVCFEVTHGTVVLWYCDLLVDYTYEFAFQLSSNDSLN